jgi:hypothetical protein
MNRVRDWYDIAVIYLSLAIRDRLIIASHFKAVKPTHLTYTSKDAVDRKVFQTIALHNKLSEFKKYVIHYKKSQFHDYD